MTTNLALPLNDLFGFGVKMPLAVDSAGRLRTSEGEARIWQAVQEIIDTPLGSRPFNPRFGVPPMVYELATDPRAVAWQIGNAIARGEPRARDIVVDIQRVVGGTIELRIGITPIGTNNAVNKIFPVYRIQ